MNRTYRIVLSVTSDVYDRMCGRAAEHSLDVNEWATRQVITASMPRKLTKRELRERSSKAAYELISLLLRKPEPASKPPCPGGESDRSRMNLPTSEQPNLQTAEPLNPTSGASHAAHI